jgi:hypothetical protein
LQKIGFPKCICKISGPTTCEFVAPQYQLCFSWPRHPSISLQTVSNPPNSNIKRHLLSNAQDLECSATSVQLRSDMYPPVPIQVCVPRRKVGEGLFMSSDGQVLYTSLYLFKKYVPVKKSALQRISCVANRFELAPSSRLYSCAILIQNLVAERFFMRPTQLFLPRLTRAGQELVGYNVLGRSAAKNWQLHP